MLVQTLGFANVMPVLMLMQRSTRGLVLVLMHCTRSWRCTSALLLGEALDQRARGALVSWTFWRLPVVVTGTALVLWYLLW